MKKFQPRISELFTCQKVAEFACFWLYVIFFCVTKHLTDMNASKFTGVDSN